MKVLLVHPEDNFSPGCLDGEFDLIVDCARELQSVYLCWSRVTRCPILSLYDFAEGLEDFRRCGALLRTGRGQAVDGYGIDWWDVLSLKLVSAFLGLLLVERLARYIGQADEISTSRPSPTATALRNRLGCKLTVAQTPTQRISTHVSHCWRTFLNLDHSQLSQVAQDKFDRHYAIRHRFSPRIRSSATPVVLLPSAYVNVTRTALRYAEQFPEQQFLLVCARKSAEFAAVPSNVTTESLSSYFQTPKTEETNLFSDWKTLRRQLGRDTDEFRALEQSGDFDRIESDLQWGINIRNAWNRLYDSHNVVGCFCADDTNPLTRIPLLIAQHWSIPAVVSHHGSLDCWMSLKSVIGDRYLAKSDMEEDYLLRTCHVPTEKIIRWVNRQLPVDDFCSSDADSIVFFTEAYELCGWRSESVYRDLLPKLRALAEVMRLRLVIKLHPFESQRKTRKLLQRVLGNGADRIEIVSGPISTGLWCKIRLAITAQSSVALDCARRGIPIFLLTWLADVYSGYAAQFQKFGVGHALTSSDQILDIPQTIAEQSTVNAKTAPELRAVPQSTPELSINA